MNHNLIDEAEEWDAACCGDYDSKCSYCMTDFSGSERGEGSSCEMESIESGLEDVLSDEDAPPPAPTGYPFSFNYDDAVWFRRQLSGWGAGRGREDSERCVISPVVAHEAYDIPWDFSALDNHDSALFRGRQDEQPRHAAAFAQQLQEGAAQRSSGLDAAAYEQLVTREKATANRWQAGHPLPALLLLLIPTAVAQHSVLPFFSFEDAMELRVLSRALHPLVEAAAMAQLDRRKG